MGKTESGRRKLARWTDREEKLLRDLWGTCRDSQIAATLGKTVSSVRFKAGAMGLREEKGRRAGCRPGRVTYPWNKDEDLILMKNVGHLNIFELMEQLPRRNRLAIERRCYELGFSPTQGTYTRLHIERETGYDWRQIKRARDALGQNWKRYGFRKYMITFDQVQEITEYLRDEKRKWSLQYGLDKCRACGASGDAERDRHSGDGLCKRCWDFRRHTREAVLLSIERGKSVILTEDIWYAYIRDEDGRDISLDIEARATA
jgi:hypothetical protein